MGFGGVVVVAIMGPHRSLGGVPVRNVVHPIDKAKHPSWAGTHRWCVQVGADPCDVPSMLQAGVSESAAAAARDGDAVAVAVVKALDLAGVPVDWPGVTFLDSDPLPPD